MEDTPEEPSPKRRTTKKQKMITRSVSPDVKEESLDCDKLDTDTTETESPLPATKRTRKVKTPKEPKETKEPVTDLESSTDLEEIPTPTVINPTDPCQVLPTELWHQILTLFPLSSVAPLSMVSKTWLYNVRSYPAWRIICEKAKLGEPKQKYRSYMALACSQSYFLCDKCYSYSRGRPRGSMIPLPIANKDDNETVWMLCLDCRLEYYSQYPEPLPEIEFARITKTRVHSHYHMTEQDLLGFGFREKINPHYACAAPMRLYRRKEIIERAMELHGGLIGIRSFSKGVLKKRREACKKREAGFKMRTVVRKPKVIEGQEGEQPQQCQEQVPGDQQPLLTTTEEPAQTDHNQYD
ncbi:hypothetical protein B0O80DRAFT_465327 [Mortierella sp. GBAus27b]|nr:hypothetical protein B0O80DRAFT_465327 [Mortierella sp. GBAus27b]